MIHLLASDIVFRNCLKNMPKKSILINLIIFLCFIESSWITFAHNLKRWVFEMTAAVAVTSKMQRQTGGTECLHSYLIYHCVLSLLLSSLWVAIINKSKGPISTFSGRKICFFTWFFFLLFIDVSMFSLPAIICFLFLPSLWFFIFFFHFLWLWKDPFACVRSSVSQS